MKFGAILFLLILAWLGPFTVIGSDFEDEQTPIEKDDIKTLDQLSDKSSYENELTPIERDDVKTLDQLSDENSFENKSTPIERDDIKTIDQVNE